MSSTTTTLAWYLLDTKDATGVVNFIREKWPKSLSSYISQTKATWMTLDVISEDYAAQYTSAVATVDAAIAIARSAEKEMLRSAKSKLESFNAMNLAGKHAVQRRLKSSQYSGHAMVDDLIAQFTIFPEYINDLKVSVPERTALQKQATAALEAKSTESITVQASELISQCKAVLKDTHANPFDVASAIALLTGRRTVEIFKTGNFTAPISRRSQRRSGFLVRYRYTFGL